jgi:hypothetical protein
MTPTRATPPLAFDGLFFWYTEWVDPTDDRCSRCRGAIAEDSVPLILFQQRRDGATWQARFCERCSEALCSRMTRGGSDGG